MIFYTATCLHQRCDSVLMRLADEQVRVLLIRSRQQVLRDLELLLPALFDALGGGSDRVVLEALSVQVGALCTGPCFSSHRAPVLRLGALLHAASASLLLQDDSRLPAFATADKVGSC